ncbi:MAG: DUF6364 family protein [Thermaerobacter sp.]|nr:DUF6364 family protein [Thermaerobacter sp.]
MKNVTLSLPKEVLQEVKIIAARRGTSISSLLTFLLTDLVRQEDQYEAARRRSLAWLDRGLDLGTRGEIPTSHEDLNER